MMCWITTNLVMDVLMPLGGASVDGWSFIRFHMAMPSLNDLLQRACVWFLNTKTGLGCMLVARVPD